MTLTIFFNNSKSKQVVKLSDNFCTDNKGQPITKAKMNEKAYELATDIAGSHYLTHDLDIPQE